LACRRTHFFLFCCCCCSCLVRTPSPRTLPTHPPHAPAAAEFKRYILSKGIAISNDELDIVISRAFANTGGAGAVQAGEGLRPAEFIDVVERSWRGSPPMTQAQAVLKYLRVKGSAAAGHAAKNDPVDGDGEGDVDAEAVAAVQSMKLSVQRGFSWLDELERRFAAPGEKGAVEEGAVAMALPPALQGVGARLRAEAARREGAGRPSAEDRAARDAAGSGRATLKDQMEAKRSAAVELKKQENDLRWLLRQQVRRCCVAAAARCPSHFPTCHLLTLRILAVAMSPSRHRTWSWSSCAARCGSLTPCSRPASPTTC